MTIPQIGETAPVFTLKDQDNQDVSLADYRGKQPVLLVFYPFAFSGVCSGELCTLRDDWSSLAGEDVKLLTVSVDSVFAHRVWAEQEGFQFRLLSDFWPHGSVASSYGIYDDVKGVAKRASFLIDQEGVVRWSVVNDVPNARDAADYAKAIASLA